MRRSLRNMREVEGELYEWKEEEERDNLDIMKIRK